MERTCKGRNWMKLVEEELDCFPHSLWPIRPYTIVGEIKISGRTTQCRTSGWSFYWKRAPTNKTQAPVVCRKGPVVACRGKMWQEVAQTKKSRGMVAKMWKDSRGSRTLQKSESWDGFWVLVLTPAAPILLLSPTEQQCYGAGGGLDPSIL